MKIWNYIFIFTGVAILMAIAGLNVAGFTALFNIIGVGISGVGITALTIESTLWTTIFGTGGLLISISAGSAIGIGTFIYTKDKSFLMIPIITGVLFYWISVLVSIINYTRDYPVWGLLTALIMIPLTVGFVQSSVDYFLGVD